MAHLTMNIVSNGGGRQTTVASSAAGAVDPTAVAALQNDVAELKGHLAARDRSVIVRWEHLYFVALLTFGNEAPFVNRQMQHNIFPFVQGCPKNVG